MSTESGVSSVCLRNDYFYAKFVDENGKPTSRDTGVTRRREAQRIAAGMEVFTKASVERDVIMPGGIEGRRAFHSLRHSFTSWLAEADVRSDIRPKLTGHKSAGVHDLYAHRDESLARAIKELPDLTSVAANGNE